MSTNSVAEVHPHVTRHVTDDEVATYEEQGWVKLGGLITPETTAALLEAGERLLEATRSAPDAVRDCVVGLNESIFQARKIRLDPFHSFTLSRDLGAVAHRLMNRRRLTDEEVGVRYCEDALICKFPLVEEAQTNTIPFHQDLTFGTDRVGGFNVWIALDEVTPEQGSMRFLTGSHREGALGNVVNIVERYPKLTELYEWSEPLHYQPGDATVHHGYMIHGSGDNRGSRPRWSYVPTYIPADCVQGEPPSALGYLDEEAEDERFPLVFP